MAREKTLQTSLKNREKSLHKLSGRIENVYKNNSIFTKNFSWIAPAGKAIKSFFSPLALIIIAIVALLVASNYYFYKGNANLKQELQLQAKKYKDLNKSTVALRAEYIKSIDLLKTKETQFKRTLKTLEDLHTKRKKEVKHYAKQKEKNKHLKDAPIAPVLRNTLNSLLQEANSTYSAN